MASEHEASGGGLNRFLAGAIISVLSLIVGVGGGFTLAYTAPTEVPMAQPGDAPAPAAAAAPIATSETCTIHARTEDGALRADLANVALVDITHGRELDAEIEHQQTVRLACPELSTVVDVALGSADGVLYHADVALDGAHHYAELGAEAGEVADFIARRTEAGIADPAPEWLSAAPDADSGDGGSEPAGEPPPLEGSIYVEVRDLEGNARKKPDIRNLVNERGGEIEACVKTHDEGRDRARHHYQLYIDASGEVVGSLLLEGVSEALDACVEQVVTGWNFGAADAPSFFKLKTVWSE